MHELVAAVGHRVVGDGLHVALRDVVGRGAFHKARRARADGGVAGHAHVEAAAIVEHLDRVARFKPAGSKLVGVHLDGGLHVLLDPQRVVELVVDVEARADVRELQRVGCAQRAVGPDFGTRFPHGKRLAELGEPVVVDVHATRGGGVFAVGERAAGFRGVLKRPHSPRLGKRVERDGAHVRVFGRGEDGARKLDAVGGKHVVGDAHATGDFALDPQVGLRLEQGVDDLFLQNDLVVAHLHVAEVGVELEARRGGEHVVGPLRAFGEVRVDRHDEVERARPVLGLRHVREVLRHHVAAEDGGAHVVLLGGHVVGGDGGLGAGGVFGGKRPGAERAGLAGPGASDVDAHARARLADVAGKGDEQRGRMTCDIGVRHLVVAAPAERQARRALCVLAGKLADLVFGDAGDARRPCGRVGRVGFDHDVVHRARGGAGDGRRAGKRRGRDRGIRSGGTGRRVDHEEGVDAALLGLFRGFVDRVVADELARRRIDEERQARVLGHELLIGEPLFEDDRDHAQEQRGVGAGLDGHPFVGLRGGGGEMRVDRDHLRAGFLRLEEQADLGKRRLAEVRPDGEHHAGIDPVARVGGGGGIAAAVADRRIEAVSDADVDAGEPAAASAQKRRQVRGVHFRRRHDHDRVLAAFGLDALDAIGDGVERLIPADLGELVRSALARALERRLDAPCAVDMLDLGDALQADGAVAVVGACGIRLDKHHAAVAHGALQRAHAAAMRLMVGAGGVFGRLLVGFGGTRHKPASRLGHARRSGKPERGSRGACALEKASAGKAVFQARRF